MKRPRPVTGATRRGFLRGLLSGGAAVAAMAALPPGVLPEDLTDEELEAACIRVDWSQLDIGGDTFTIYNPRSSPVEVRGVAYGTQREGTLWTARIELRTDDERFVWGLG